MGQNLDYLSTNQPTDEYTHKLQHRVLEMRDDKEWKLYDVGNEIG